MASIKYNILSLFLFFAILCLCLNCPAQPPCQKFALVIDGGDGYFFEPEAFEDWKTRVHALADTVADNFEEHADSIAEWLRGNGFQVTRRSQYWYTNDPQIYDTGEDSMKNGLRDIILDYASSIKCLPGEKCCHELFIYIVAHGTPKPDPAGFALYTPLRTGRSDFVSYSDLASWLLKLPPCVKLTIFIDSCHSGRAINELRTLCERFGGCGVTIMTATDEEKTTPSGVEALKAPDSATEDFMEGAGKDNDGDGDKGDIKDRWKEMEQEWGNSNPQMEMCKEEGQTRMCSLEEVQEEVQKEPAPPRIPTFSLGDGLESGALALAIDGTGTTTRMACTITNKTSDSCTVVIPTGTPLEPGSKDHQPYQTGYIPPIELGPGETETVEVPAFCTDSEKEPAPADGSVAYTLHEGPLTPEQEKITEIIVVTNTLRQLHETCGKVAEPDDFLVAVAGGPPPLTVPTPLEVPKPTEPTGPPEPEPKVYGPPLPPKPRTPGEEELREKWKKELDEWIKKHGTPSPPRPPYKPKPVYVPPLGPPPFDPDDLPPVRIRPVLPEDFYDVLEWFFRVGPPFEGIPEPPPGPPEPAPPEGFEVPPGTLVLPPDVILLSLSGPLEFPGTTQFTLAEVPELKTNISSRKEKGEAVFSNPAGKVAVSLAPTEDPNVVKFNITKLEARSPSFKALGKSRKDINIALNSPEKSTGTLNIKTGEVAGTVSVKAWGKKYDEPFPAAASYTGRFDIPTKKLSLNLRGTSFEPVDLEEGLYQRIRPEKFWDAVMLYSIWKETNNQGKEELKKVMTEQLRADFPKERAEGLSALVAGEIVHRVDEVHERHKKLKKEEADFSILDPTLKWRKT